MMETWRLNMRDENEAPIRRAFDPRTSRPIVQQACNTCRAKKLRCTGEKTGCSRCEALDMVCIYAVAGKKRRREAVVHGEPRAVPARPNLTRTSKKEVATKLSAPSKPDEQSDFNRLGYEHLNPNIGSFEIRRTAHMPPTPLALSGDPGLSDQGQGQPMLTIFDIFSNADYDGHLSSMNERGIFDEWPLLNTIDLEQWGSTLASPPDEPARLTSVPQDSVLPPGSTPANGVSQQPADLVDLLGGKNNQSIGEPTSPAVQSCQPSKASPRTECRCLQPVVFLIDELEVGRSTVESQGLDARLASHKEALRYGQALIECQRCRLRPEHMTILKFLTDKLAGLSEQIVDEYTRGLLHPAAPAEGTMVGGNSMDSEGSGTLPWLAVLGSYEVDSAREWNTLIGTLIKLQLEALYTLVEAMKAVSHSMHWDAMFGWATATQGRIVPMLYRIQSLCRSGGGTDDATVFCDSS